MPDRQTAYPWDREVEYVAALAATGGVFGFIAWAVADFLRPDLDLDLGKWVAYAGGLAGSAALFWVIGNAFYA